MNKDMDALLVLPKLKVCGANTFSSPITWGFPSITAFAGFTEALSRKSQGTLGLHLDAFGVVCHEFHPGVYKADDYSTRFHQVASPLDKAGKRPSIQEEGKGNMVVSLILGISDPEGILHCSGREIKDITVELCDLIHGLRCAGGTISNTAKVEPTLEEWPGTPEEVSAFYKKVVRRIRGGFTLVSREAVLEEHLQELRRKDASASLLDALIDRISLHKKGAEVVPSKGWMVPIPNGYQRISTVYAPGEVKNTRDVITPTAFVESTYTLGEWRSPLNIGGDISHLLWYSEVSDGFYTLTTPYFAKENNV